MRKSLLIAINILISQFCFSQISSDGIPVSFSQTLSREVPTIELVAPNIIALEKEDNDNALKGKPYRYAVQLECDIDPSKDGLWENLENGIRVWRVNIKSEEAQALSLIHISEPTRQP